MQNRLLDIDSIASKFNTFRMNLNDYEMITPTLARVIINYTGEAPVEREQIRATIARLFEGTVMPVAESFRRVTANVIVGFVKTAREAKEFDESRVTAGKMKEMAANLLMDTEDQTLWEKKKGSAGTYLVRQGNDDLTALVHLACKSQTTQPTLAHLASVPAEPREFAAFLSKDSEEVEHGYVVASAEDKMTVIPYGSDEAVEIEQAQLVEVLNLDGDDVKAFGTDMAAEVAADKGAMIEYYRKVFGYDTAYLSKIIDMINQHAVA